VILVWIPSYLLFRDFDTWQLAVNTPTTIGTWLLVALLQNAQRRADQATQHKLNAIAAALAELMRERADPNEPDARTTARMAAARRELRAAVGLEERESV
jgi:low affinity Fe/Cu permease